MGVGFQIPIKNLVSILTSTAVKTARVASLSGLKTLSFPHTVIFYEESKRLERADAIAQYRATLFGGGNINNAEYVELSKECRIEHEECILGF